MATKPSPKAAATAKTAAKTTQVAPVQAEASTEQAQVVSQEYFAQPYAAPVQYVVMSESLKGIKGWLMFFLIVFVLSAVGYISVFFNSINMLSSASGVISLIFSPFIAISAITTVALISMGKKMGRWFAILTIGLSTFFSILLGVINFATGASVGYSSYNSGTQGITSLISGIVISLLFAVLFSLYFINSRRVKETLVD